MGDQFVSGYPPTTHTHKHIFLRPVFTLLKKKLITTIAKKGHQDILVKRTPMGTEGIKNFSSYRSRNREEADLVPDRIAEVTVNEPGGDM